jgi:hypothetical protein
MSSIDEAASVRREALARLNACGARRMGTRAALVDPVRWFDNVGSCQNCGGQGHGKLMGPSNESYGVYCRRCADARLKRAEKQRKAPALACHPAVPLVGTGETKAQVRARVRTVIAAKR